MRSNSAKNLLDFLNHGILPFVGRDTELEKLVRFWSSTIDAGGLRTALLVGEAGIGKSRLVEELIPRVITPGGGVVHAKLYPESATNIISLLSRSLWQSVVGKELLRKQPEETKESLIDALRRISGLRPTIIIVEDTHLLSSDAVREFLTLLESLSDETISILALTRPVSGGARAIFERYLTEEIILEGLSRDAFIDVCEQLFGGAIDDEVISALEKATLGNALALRSALRGALKTGFLDRKDERSLWKMTVPPAAFIRHLENNVRTLSEGMAAHLDDEERVAVEALSVLGELFSVEAAQVLIKDASKYLERLRFKGVLTTSTSAQSPLVGEQSEYPLLAFSHSLLHKYFYEHTHIWGDEVARLLAKDVPLYGIAPFLLLSTQDVSSDITSEEMREVIVKSSGLAKRLDSGLDWELAKVLWKALDLIFTKSKKIFSDELNTELGSEIIRIRLTLLRRQLPTEEFKAPLDKLLAITASPKDTLQATRRIHAHVCEYWYLRRAPGSDASIPDLKKRVGKLLEEFPDAICTMEYLVFLNYIAQYASEIRSQEWFDEVAEQANKILVHPKKTSEIENFVYGFIYPHFLAFFRTKEEAEERIALARKIESMDNYLKGAFYSCYRDLLFETGKLQEVAQLLHDSFPFFRSHGFKYSMFTSDLYKNMIEIILTGETIGRHDIMSASYSYLPQEKHTLEGGNTMVLKGFLISALLIGDKTFAKEVNERYFTLEGLEAPEYHILYRLQNDLPFEDLLSIPPQKDSFRVIFEILKEKAIDESRLERESVILLQSPIVRFSDILDHYFAIELLEKYSPDPLREEITSGLRLIFDWSYLRSLPNILKAALTNYGKYFEGKELKQWNTKLTKLQKQGAGSVSKDEKLTLTMLGAIEIRKPDGTLDRVRGARLRSVLGMMVANIMLKDPLTHREFCFIAAGEKDDPDLARKTVNMAISSLRDDIGADAIITTGDTPTLNHERIAVDIIEASDLLDDAARSIRRGSLVKAFPDVMRVLDLALGKVPFPTLYDNLFEALRDDFDSRIRKVTLDLSKRLLVEGDTKNALTLLGKFFQAIPDDAEFAELLARTLEESGEKAEAERIRMKLAELVR